MKRENVRESGLNSREQYEFTPYTASIWRFDAYGLIVSELRFQKEAKEADFRFNVDSISFICGNWTNFWIFYVTLPSALIWETLIIDLWLVVKNDDNLVVIRNNQSQIIFHIVAEGKLDIKVFKSKYIQKHTTPYSIIVKISF